MLEFIFILLQAFFVYWMSNHIFICKFKGQKKMSILSLAAIVDTLFVYYCPINNPILRIFIFTIFTFIIIQSLFNGNYLTKIFFVLLNNYLFLVSDTISENLLSWINQITAHYFISIELTLWLLSKMIAFLLVVCFIKLFKKINFNISNKYWLIINVIIAIFIILMSFLLWISTTTLQEYPNYTSQIVTISLIMLIMSILVIYLFGEICYFYQDEQHRYALEIKNHELEQQLAFQEYSTTDLRKIRHDINNNLVNLLFLIEESHYEESIKYLKAITNTLESTKSVIRCGNYYIDSIINYEFLLCKKNKINAQFEVDNIPDLMIKPTDISSIISNILMNAIEANLKLTESERYISLNVFIYKNYFTIIVKNPYQYVLLDSDGKLSTSKKDNRYHGYGIKIVNDCVKKYGGHFQYFHENNIFTVKIILPLSLT